MFNLEIKTLVVGPLLTNCYIVADKETKQAFILDPGAEPEKILSCLTPENSDLRSELGALRPMTYDLIALMVTHCHSDHIGATAQLKRKLNIPFLIPKGEGEILVHAEETSKFWTGQEIETPPRADGFLKDGDKIKIGQVKFKIISTPGHSPAGISLYAKDAKLDAKNAKGVLFSGDTLFASSIGRTDLPGGSDEKMKQSLKKLLQLPNETLVLPGHGEKTTIGKEKRRNPFLVAKFRPCQNFKSMLVYICPKNENSQSSNKHPHYQPAALVKTKR